MSTEFDWSKMSPAAMWRDWLVKSEAQWSDSMSQLLKDPKTGGAIKRQVDEMRMVHRQFSEFAQVALSAANLPSRSDFEALDERLGRVEDGIAQISAQLVSLRDAMVRSDIAEAAPKPARNRRPPAAVSAVAAPPAAAAAPAAARRPAAKRAAAAKPGKG